LWLSLRNSSCWGISTPVRYLDWSRTCARIVDGPAHVLVRVKRNDAFLDELLVAHRELHPSRAWRKKFCMFENLLSKLCCMHVYLSGICLFILPCCMHVWLVSIDHSTYSCSILDWNMFAYNLVSKFCYLIRMHLHCLQSDRLHPHLVFF